VAKTQLQIELVVSSVGLYQVGIECKHEVLKENSVERLKIEVRSSKEL
jgi:hypothetical protein